MKYIECHNVTKQFGNNLVLDNFNYIFSSDSINFITGSNGIGKSTLISCVLEFLKYDGLIKHNISKIAYQPEKVILPDYIKLKDYLTLISNIRHQKCEKEIERLINLFGLEKVMGKELHKLSKGMRQKVLLIQTLMLDVDGYFFDEPLNGLDPLSQQKFILELKKLFDNNKMIIIITHFIEQYDIEPKKIVNLNYKEYYQNAKVASTVFTK